MKEKTKNILIAVLVVGLVSMTVAYAALTQVLNINAGAKVLNKSDTWNIHFANLSAPTLGGYATVPTGSELVLSNDSTTLSGLEANLKAPGDYVEYTFKVVNEGSINAKVSAVVLGSISGATYTGGSAADRELVQNNLEYTLTYSNGTAIAQNDALAASGEATLKLHVGYKSTATDLPAATVTVGGLNAHIDYVQAPKN